MNLEKKLDEIIKRLNKIEEKISNITPKSMLSVKD